MIESRWTPTNQQLVYALQLQYPEVRTTGLVPALKAAFPEVYDDLDTFKRYPDGYVIRQSEREVDIFEVEVTHAIPLSTMRDIFVLRGVLDSLDIEMRCYVVNRYGHINELDLSSWYFEVMHGNVANGKNGSGKDAPNDAGIPGEDCDEARVPGAD